MTPERDNLTGDEGIFKGRDFVSGTYTAKDSNGDVIDLTDYIIEAQIRECADRDAEKIADFIVTPTPLSGVFVLSLTDTITSLLTQSSGFYDILVQDAAGIRETWVIGEIDINESTTVKIA
jgi:hypothetical protein